MNSNSWLEGYDLMEGKALVLSQALTLSASPQIPERPHKRAAVVRRARPAQHGAPHPAAGRRE